MTSRATITEAELRRAVKVADGLGKVVCIVGGRAYILAREEVPGRTPVDDSPPRPEQAEEW